MGQVANLRTDWQSVQPGSARPAPPPLRTLQVFDLTSSARSAGRTTGAQDAIPPHKPATPRTAFPVLGASACYGLNQLISLTMEASAIASSQMASTLFHAFLAFNSNSPATSSRLEWKPRNPNKTNTKPSLVFSSGASTKSMPQPSPRRHFRPRAFALTALRPCDVVGFCLESPHNFG